MMNTPSISGSITTTEYLAEDLSATSNPQSSPTSLPRPATEYLYSNDTSNYMDRNNPEIRQAKKQLLKEAYSPMKRRQELLCFGLFLILLPTAVLNIFIALFNSITFTLFTSIVLGTFGGLLLADFMSGLVHWTADTWGNLEWPIIGKTLLRSFREHHVAPSAMCNHDIVETNSDNLMMILLPLFLLCRSQVSPVWFEVFFYCFWLSACVGIALTNQIHKWTHTYRPPAMVVWLQSTGLILTKENHLIHHRPNFDGYYCITTGWLNPILEKTKFWKKLEKVVSALTGLVPREDDYRWTGLVAETPDVVKKYIQRSTQQLK